MGKSAAPLLAHGGCSGSSLACQEAQSRPISLVANCNQPTDVVPPELTSPPWELEVAHQWAPTPGFLEVTACLRSQLPEEVPKTPPVPLTMGMMMTPGVTTMSASHVICDEATRATYLAMVTTSVGRVTLSGPEGKILDARAHDRRYHTPHLKGNLIVHLRAVRQTEFANDCHGTAELAIYHCRVYGTF